MRFHREDAAYIPVSVNDLVRKDRFEGAEPTPAISPDIPSVTQSDTNGKGSKRRNVDLKTGRDDDGDDNDNDDDDDGGNDEDGDESGPSVSTPEYELPRTNVNSLCLGLRVYTDVTAPAVVTGRLRTEIEAENK